MSPVYRYRTAGRTPCTGIPYHVLHRSVLVASTRWPHWTHTLARRTPPRLRTRFVADSWLTYTTRPPVPAVWPRSDAREPNVCCPGPVAQTDDLEERSGPQPYPHCTCPRLRSRPWVDPSWSRPAQRVMYRIRHVFEIASSFYFWTV